MRSNGYPQKIQKKQKSKFQKVLPDALKKSSAFVKMMAFSAAAFQAAPSNRS